MTLSGLLDLISRRFGAVTMSDMLTGCSLQVFHYAVELFEGMKAYRGVDNRIRLFRPEMNMARMRKTAARSALPVSHH